MVEEQEKRRSSEDEIDLIELTRSIWAGRLFIAKVTSVFIIIGLIIAFTSPVEYEATCKLLPESQEAQMPSLGGLAGLAGLAGVDLSSMGGSSGVMTPQLYPEIVNSLPFILEVMNDTIYFERQDIHATSFNYFKNIVKPSVMGYILKYTIGLPGLIFSNKPEDIISTKDDLSFYRISKEDWRLIESFKERIILEIDSETGIVEVMVEMPDPYAAAQIAKKIELMVTGAVVEYKTGKSLKNLEFILEAHDESKRKYESVQYQLARSTDRNRNVNSATAQIELKKLEYEFNLAYEVYKGLSSQVEQAKIKLKEETPVFTVLEPVRIPGDKSKPKRAVILIVLMVMGCMIGTIILFCKFILVGKRGRSF
ncbi:Wzz/FepE/Etk N-terminal domain-containing protein [Reichenbachiella agarivorans]|uniref:Wzz/FepE/Etk N-terminal domain-containing protein n=1 Tax=Reichenbachiella agarivorans TaxID=2979464 RepID=A0ABY6CSR6_9BACT|nr:Wzz/FepE/Etk N-terminal domain-containing protein [Reichenbachiella agarivorans]UXP33557.1 Wzz/FepE/Etk N-terminal domain-containing protein [Reichenbachiella agarivorans]